MDSVKVTEPDKGMREVIFAVEIESMEIILLVFVIVIVLVLDLFGFRIFVKLLVKPLVKLFEISLRILDKLMTKKHVKKFESDILYMNIDVREKLIYLLEQYVEGKYKTFAFAVNFTKIYRMEMDYSMLSEKEDKLFGYLSADVEEFLSFEADSKYNSEYIVERAKSTYLELRMQ